jgi:hypothetical protein
MAREARDRASIITDLLVAIVVVVAVPGLARRRGGPSRRLRGGAERHGGRSFKVIVRVVVVYDAP